MRYTNLLALLLLGATPAVALEPLTVRVSDLEGAPGEIVTIVLRTYSPRALGQGQICLRGNQNLAPFVGATTPFSELIVVQVFSAGAPASSNGQIEPTGEVMLSFLAPDGSVNLEGGVLAAIHVRLAEGLLPGTNYEVAIDLPNTVILGPGGQEVELVGRSGQLRVLSPGADRRLSVDDDRVEPGAFLELGIQTLNPFPIGSGDVELTWAAGFTIGTPVVSMDQRHGNATFTADVSIPNRVAVSFSSADGTLNQVPGEIIEILVQTDPTRPDGIGHLTLAATSEVRDPLGVPIPLVLVSGEIEVERDNAIFIDSFESGATTYWGVGP